jgi:CubicO group peptidase (beta-lactamase class C family)
MLTDDEIGQMLIHRIEVQGQAVGIAVGVVDKNGQRTISHGAFSPNDPRPVGADTVFEIGSVTKVFTSLLLMDLVHHGALALEDHVGNFLEGVKLPSRNGRFISLVDLSTHTSGLPRIPTNYRPADLSNPYADFTFEKLCEFFATFSLDRDIGTQFDYSNLGGGLLGLALAQSCDLSYEQAVKQRILEPLELQNTGIELTPSMRENLAPGHSRNLKPTIAWDFGILAGAGALRSTPRDILKFLSVPLGYAKSPLHPPMSAMLSVRRPTGRDDMHVGLGWMLGSYSGRTVAWHNGATGGYRSFIGYERESGVGVCVLSNTCSAVSVDDIGLKILIPRV